MSTTIKILSLLIIAVIVAMGCDSVTNSEPNMESAILSESIEQPANVVSSSTIITPKDGDVVYGVVDFIAEYGGTLESSEFAWAVREGGGDCPINAPSVADWTDGTPYTAEDGKFSTSIDMSSYSPGTYCFAINPDGQLSGAPDFRKVSVFELGLSPDNKNQCKNEGWTEYGFKNQGQCIRYVNTGKDSR